jgi:hypothetical protein
MFELILDNIIPVLGGSVCIIYGLFLAAKKKQDQKPLSNRVILLLICGLGMLLVSVFSIIYKI